VAWEASFSARPFSAFCAFELRGDCIASNCLTTHKTDSESRSKVSEMLSLTHIENLRLYILSFVFNFELF